MTLRMEGQPLLLQVAVWDCVAVFVVSFFTALCTNLLVINRTGVLVNRAEDQELGWGERQGRKFSRFSRFLVTDEFRSLRRVSFGAWTGVAVSLGSLFLLMLLFGERT